METNPKENKMKKFNSQMTSTRLFLSVCAMFATASGAALAQADGSAGRDGIDDEDVVVAIESDLGRAREVPLNDLDVSCDAGVVTLEGEVNKILAKERAVRMASMTKGVRSVVDMISVSPPDIDDTTIMGEVNSALARDPATSSWQVDVAVEGGEVTLTGTVDSRAEKELASLVAKGVRGVTGLENRLEISFESGRLDGDIQDEIEERLAWDVRVDDYLVDVAVENGEARLSGFVGSDFERNQAVDDAWVAGVRSVDDSDLMVRWWARDEMIRKDMWNKPDAEVRKAVEAALVFDPRVFSFEPEVKVENGLVTLRGTVDNLKARRAAAQDAANTNGVRGVKNLLKVRSKEDLTDEQVEQEIRTALSRDAIVQRSEVTVAVDEGEARLYGLVDSYFERFQAEDVAARVPGVTAVRNYLTVDYVSPPYAYGYRGYHDWDPLLYDFDFDYDTVRKKPDWEIEGDIESELFWSPFVDADEVNVAVDDGVATLTGTVDSWSELQAASDNALEGGAYKVHNRLEVDYGAPLDAQ
jgi:osmotically-inducible protein OsmY